MAPGNLGTYIYKEHAALRLALATGLMLCDGQNLLIEATDSREPTVPLCEDLKQGSG